MMPRAKETQSELDNFRTLPQTYSIKNLQQESSETIFTWFIDVDVIEDFQFHSMY